MSARAPHRAPESATAQRVKLLLLEAETSRRLLWISALRGAFDVVGLEEGEDPLRVVRAARPALVLLSAEGAGAEEALRLAHRLKTGPHPPALGVVCPGRARPSPEHVLVRTQADGYLGGDVNPERLLAWSIRLRRGERAVEDLPLPPRNPLRRLFG